MVSNGHCNSESQNLRTPMKVRNPEAQSDLPTGALAEDFAHLQLGLWAHISLVEELVYDLCIRDHQRYVTYRIFGGQLWGEDIRGRLTGHKHVHLKKISIERTKYSGKTIIGKNLLVCACKRDLCVVLQGIHLVFAHLQEDFGSALRYLMEKEKNKHTNLSPPCSHWPMYHWNSCPWKQTQLNFVYKEALWGG